MKRLAMLLVLAGLMAVPSFAQDNNTRGTIGVFYNFFRAESTERNLHGIGGRIGFNVNPNTVIEGEVAYDFKQSFSRSITSGTTTSVVTSDLRTLHLLFGPKFHFGTDRVRVFGVLKGGVLNFSTTNSVGGAFGTLDDEGDNNGVFYPGGGIEFGGRWFGFRIEAGDEIYFDRGANHNLRFTIGPEFRF